MELYSPIQIERMSQELFEANNEAMRKTVELKRVGKLLKDKRFSLMTIIDYLHQGEEEDENPVKLQLVWAQTQYNQRVARVQEDIQKTEKAIAQQNRKYDLLVEQKRNDIEAYKRKKEQEIEELEVMREVAVGKHKDKGESLEKKSDAKYYWDKIQVFSAKLVGTKRKTISHIRLEKEIEALEEEQKALVNRIQELNQIISPNQTRANLIVSTESVSDVSSIHTEELEEQHDQITILERQREEASREYEMEIKKYQDERLEKIRIIQVQNEEKRKRVKELQDVEDKLPHGSPERETARKARQQVEDKIIR